MALQVRGAEIADGAEVGEEGEGRIHQEPRVIGHQFAERLVLEGSHMGDDRGKLGIPGKEPPKGGNTHELVPHRSRADVEQAALPLRHHEFVEGEEPCVVGGEPLDEELQLETEDPGVIEEHFRHGKAVLVVGVVGGKQKRSGVSARTCRFQSLRRLAIPFRWA